MPSKDGTSVSKPGLFRELFIYNLVFASSLHGLSLLVTQNSYSFSPQVSCNLLKTFGVHSNKNIVLLNLLYGPSEVFIDSPV